MFLVLSGPHRVVLTVLGVPQLQVVAKGPGALTREGVRIPIEVEVGAKVLLPEYGGHNVDLNPATGAATDEEELVLYRAEDILGVIEE